MSVFRVAFPALSCLSLLASPALAENCWYPHEAKAAQLRDFQTMLMVGTLQCKGVSQSSIELYNGFVSKQRGSLDANNYILKARFMRESGIEGGRVAYDEYVTGLANAQAAKLGDPSFCPTVETFVRLAADAAQPDLLKLAEAVIDPPQSGQCPPSNYYAGTRNRPRPPMSRLPLQHRHLPPRPRPRPHQQRRRRPRPKRSRRRSSRCRAPPLRSRPRTPPLRLPRPRR
jgi:hypothetical protein